MICLNGDRIHIKRFPNGEAMINSENLKVKAYNNEIKLHFESDEDITHLIFLKGHLDEMKAGCALIMPYMPYSRMDRTEGIRIFTLKHLCRLINKLKFESVTIYEPHSEVTTALLDRVNIVNMSKVLAEKALSDLRSEGEEVYLVYPDCGAEKRYGKEIAYDKVLTASKERDFNTGFIRKVEIHGEVRSSSFKAVIVDDLCSKGGTFAMTASKLKDMGASDIYLAVTHCENTIFQGELLTTNLINTIYTTDSIISREHEKIRVFHI